METRRHKAGVSMPRIVRRPAALLALALLVGFALAGPAGAEPPSPVLENAVVRTVPTTILSLVSTISSALPA